MSEADLPRRLRVIAVGAAVAAMVFTLIAVIVVVTRGGGEQTKPVEKQPPAVAQLTDRQVRATDVVRLQRKDVELVIENGTTKGLRVKDPTLVKDLGLEDGDIITALSGKPLTRELDAWEALMRISHMSATTVYVEILREDQPTLLRWRLDGDLRQARYDTNSNVFGLGTYTPPSVPPVPDPLLDTIEKVDDMHFKLPRKTAETLFADPMTYSKQARVVPSMRNGQLDGLKLYAIRPTSIYARLGFNNGDTVHAVNGLDLTSIDKALEVFTKIKDAPELTFDITRRGKPVLLLIQITK